MRTISAFALVLVLSVAAHAQSSSVDYDQSVTMVDSSGNLLVIDSGYTVTTGTNSGGTVSVFASFVQTIKNPATRITVIPHGATATSTPVVYSGATFQVIGVGKEAVYALVTVQSGTGSSRTSSQEIVAINANIALPATVAAFPSESVGSGYSVELGPANGTVDYLAVVIPATRATSTTAAVSKTAKVYSFDTSFHLVSQGNLP
jgi:hypothetical protein